MTPQRDFQPPSDYEARHHARPRHQPEIPMPDLLLELFSEEIPARMQAQASEDLKKLVTDALVEKGLTYEGAIALATPRRLALHIAGLPARQPDLKDERKGPRVGAPEAALAGFLKSAGLASIADAKIEKDPKGKGEFYVAVIERKGLETGALLADLLPSIIRSFPWPKSMRWGKTSINPDALRWVRPLQSIVATFGPETEEPEIVHFNIDGIEAGDITYGHRFMAPAAIKVKRWDDYVPALERAKVVLDPARRRDMILHDAKNLALAQGLELVEDEGLLAEVAGLVEWPVVLMGEFESSFLDIPAEVIRATIRANQKCFVLRGPDGKLANKFILVSNIEASDGGVAIAAGNGRVVRARLSDALYFWQTDKAPLPDYADTASLPLDQRLAKLRALNIVFHEKLGTQGARVDRIMALAAEIAPLVNADPVKARRAAELAKADLMTEVVGEFPETQGLMGRRYAQLQGEDASVAIAIEDHYRPQGPSDRVPTDPVAIAVALADKLDTLVGFWAIDEKPTGSKDPYALRRAALGVIRLVLENGLRINLIPIIAAKSQFWRLQQVKWIGKTTSQLTRPYKRVGETNEFVMVWPKTSLFGKLIEIFQDVEASQFICENFDLNEDIYVFNEKNRPIMANSFKVDGEVIPSIAKNPPVHLLAFFHDRLKVYLRDKGARHDLIDAVLSNSAHTPLPPGEGGLQRKPGEGSATPPSSDPAPQGHLLPAGEGNAANDDLLMVVARVNALASFLDTEDGKNLLAGYKRAANILRAEEKKDGAGAFDGKPEPSLFNSTENAIEKHFYDTLQVTVADVDHHLRLAEERIGRPGFEKETPFEDAMESFSTLRAPVDAFFETVTVNDPDPAVRVNRLRLLGELRAAMHRIADFSKISG